MLIENIFSSFVASAHIPVNQSLKDFALSKISADQQARQDKVTQSNFLDLNIFPIREISNIVQDRFNEIHAKIGLAKSYFHTVSEAWLNLGNNQNIDAPHCHPGRVFSAVYYLEAGNNCADLILTNPNQSLAHVIHPLFVDTYTCFNSHNHRIVPSTGLLIIFPSYLQHYVQQNIAGNQRLSLAFNSQINKS